MSNTAQNLASKRLFSLLDENSFVEIGGGITARSTDFNLGQKDTPADGVITGYGVIDGNLVYVYSQDVSVLNGAIGEMHAKKIVHIYDLALKMGAPVIGLIDCAGLRLQEATDALNGFGEIYLKQSFASGVIPQITAILGNSGGGISIMQTLTDFTFMEEKNGKLFVNSPNALEKNEISKKDTSLAKFQSEEAGSVDFVASEQVIFAKIRELINLIPANNEDDLSYDDCTDDLNRTSDGLKNSAADASLILSNISDNYRFYEIKEAYGKEMITGFIKLNGVTVGAIANRTKIYDENGGVVEEFAPVLTTVGCEKAAEFANFCDAFGIPILTLTNVEGYKATIEEERTIAKAAGKLTYTFANATVPKVNIIIGKAFGSGYLTMNSKSIGADQVFAWENAQIGMMDATLAANIIYAEEIADAKDPASLIKEKALKYEALQTNVESAARRGYVDTIIKAGDTRKYVIGAFEMLFTKREDRPGKKHGTVL